LGDRAKLSGEPQHWFLAPGWENPFAKPAILPRKIEAGKEVILAMDLAAPEGGWRKEGRLRLQTLAPMSGKDWAIKFNGVSLAPTDDIREPFPNPDPPLLGTAETLSAWIVPRTIPRNGTNEVTVELTAGQPNDVVFIDLAFS
jgi:hypothetical protein